MMPGTLRNETARGTKAGGSHAALQPSISELKEPESRQILGSPDWTILACKCGAQRAVASPVAGGAHYVCIACSKRKPRKPSKARMRYRETTVPEFDRVLAKWDAAQAIEQLRQHTGIRVSRRFVIPNASIDWMEVSKVLGLDAAEREVLRTRASGIPRDKALRSCGSDSERRELQAAWRRLSRRFPEMKTVLTADAETYSAKRYLFGGEK